MIGNIGVKNMYNETYRAECCRGNGVVCVVKPCPFDSNKKGYFSVLNGYQFSIIYTKTFS